MRKCAEYAPGNVDIKAIQFSHGLFRRFILFLLKFQGNGMALTIEDHKLWRKALKMTFPSAVVGIFYS